MKIKNISSNKSMIPVSVSKPDGTYVQINLEHGQIVYTEDSTMTKSLIIQQKKENIEITQDEKPRQVGIEFYKSSQDIFVVANPEKKTKLIPTDKDLIKALSEAGMKAIAKALEKESKEPIFEDQGDVIPDKTEQEKNMKTINEFFDEEKKSTIEPVKSKGGRPKGQKDTAPRKERSDKGKKIK